MKDKLDHQLVYSWKISDRFTAGVPDSYYSGREPGGVDLWVEAKFYNKLPKTIDLIGGKHPKISKLQQQWLEDRHNEGRRVAVVVGSPHGSVVFPALEWQTPLSREEFLRRAAEMRYPRHVAEWITRSVNPGYTIRKMD